MLNVSSSGTKYFEQILIMLLRHNNYEPYERCSNYTDSLYV